MKSPRVLIVYMAVNMKVCKCRMRTSYVKRIIGLIFATIERVNSPAAGALPICYAVVQSVEANCGHGLLCQKLAYEKHTNTMLLFWKCLR